MLVIQGAAIDRTSMESIRWVEKLVHLLSVYMMFLMVEDNGWQKDNGLGMASTDTYLNEM